MKERPRKLLFLTIALNLIALALPAQIMILYGHGPWELAAIASKMAPMNWLILFLAPAVSVLVFRASPWLVAALPTLVMSVIYNNWLVAQMSLDYSALSAALATTIFLASLSPLAEKQIRDLILHPQKRWWLTPIRRKAKLAIRIKFLAHNFEKKSSLGTKEFYVSTFDISEGGAFIPFDQNNLAPIFRFRSRNPESAGAALPRTIMPGTQCYISLALGDVHMIQCRAEVVRKAESNGSYPGGLGIRFLGLSWQDRRKIRDLMERVSLPQSQAADDKDKKIRLAA